MVNRDADAEALVPATDSDLCPDEGCELRGVPLWAHRDLAGEHAPGEYLLAAQAKLSWAYSRLHDLRDVAILSAKKHVGSVVVSKRDADGYPVQYRVQIPGYPFGIAMYVGDILGALRATLDYIAQGMVRDGFKRGETAFPILDRGWETDAADAKSWAAMTLGMNDDAKVFLNRFQPYLMAGPGDDREAADWLKRLRLATNRDKHRKLAEFDVAAWVTAMVRDSNGAEIVLQQRSGTPPVDNNGRFSPGFLVLHDDPGTHFVPREYDAEPEFWIQADVAIQGWPFIKRTMRVPVAQPNVRIQLAHAHATVESVFLQAKELWPSLRGDSGRGEQPTSIQR